MATIDIRRAHALGKDIARTKAESLAKGMEANGHVSVSDKEVRVEIDLPFLLRAVKGTIETRVNDELNKLMG